MTLPQIIQLFVSLYDFVSSIASGTADGTSTG